MTEYAAVVPCYNVGNASVPVILRAAELVQHCIAVDDGSKDDTHRQLTAIEKQNVIVLRHDENQGKAAALITAFRYVLRNLPAVQAIVTLDGDGQHDPELIPQFVETFERLQSDLIYGNRVGREKTMPLHRRFLNELSNRMISKVCGFRILDSQSGYRLYSRKLLEAVMGQLQTGRYEMETEILIKASRQNFKVSAVPITTIYSDAIMQLSHHSFHDVVRIGRLMIASFFSQKQR